jgi:ABC-type uncharacterized transport system ATPase subunit
MTKEIKNKQPLAPAQENYQRALALYERAVKKYSQDITPDNLKVAMETMSNDTEYKNSLENLLRAELELLEWGKEQVRRSSINESAKADILYALLHAPKYPGIMERAVDLLMKLSVRSNEQ